MAKSRDIVSLDVEKDKADIFIKLTVAPELEEFFKQLSIAEFGEKEEDYVQVSNKWLDKDGKGLKFYKNNKKLQDHIKKYIDGRYTGNDGRGNYYINIANEFGKGLYEEGEKINVAILRIVGANQGIAIKTTDLIAFEEIRLYIEQLALFVKEFYGNFIKKKQVKARISVEV